MNILHVFILGVITGMIIIPTIQLIMDLSLIWFEYFKIMPSKLIAKANKEIMELQDDCCGEVETPAIGFHYYPSEDEYIEDDDYE